MDVGLRIEGRPAKAELRTSQRALDERLDLILCCFHLRLEADERDHPLVFLVARRGPLLVEHKDLAARVAHDLLNLLPPEPKILPTIAF